MMMMHGGATATATATEGKEETLELVYRISERKEWEELQKKGETFGGDLDRSTGFIHFSKLDQVKDTLQRFFRGREGLFLLQIDSSKLGEGLVYEAVDDSNYFPHFYGPSQSFAPLPLDAVIKAEKLELQGGELSCSLLNNGAQVVKSEPFKRDSSLYMLSSNFTLIIGAEAMARADMLRFQPESGLTLDSEGILGPLASDLPADGVDLGDVPPSFGEES